MLSQSVLAPLGKLPFPWPKPGGSACSFKLSGMASLLESLFGRRKTSSTLPFALVHIPKPCRSGPWNALDTLVREFDECHYRFICDNSQSDFNDVDESLGKIPAVQDQRNHVEAGNCVPMLLLVLKGSCIF